MSQRNDKLLDVFLAQQSLGFAKFFGKLHLDSVRFNSQFDFPISETDLQRILAYNEIRDLSPQNISEENVGLVQKAIEWAQWIPKVYYGRSQRDPEVLEKYYYLCGSCSESIPVYTATFPDGRVVSSLQDHRASCLAKKGFYKNMNFIEPARTK